MGRSRGSLATKRVIETAAAFVMTTNDWPLKFHSFDQGEAWDALCWALQDLHDLVAAAVPVEETKP